MYQYRYLKTLHSVVTEFVILQSSINNFNNLSMVKWKNFFVPKWLGSAFCNIQILPNLKKMCFADKLYIYQYKLIENKLLIQ